MKKSQLKQIIKEEILKEVKGGVLNYFYKLGYSAGQMLNPLVDELIKTKGLEGAKKHIGSLVGDEPQYDMSSLTPFGEGALNEIKSVLSEDMNPKIYELRSRRVKATIDDLNQYLQNNVTASGLKSTLQDTIKFLDQFIFDDDLSEGALKEETQVAYDGEIDRLLNLITSDLAKGYTNLEKLNDVAFDAKDEYNNGFSKALDAMGDVESYLMDGVTEYDGEPGWEDRIR